MNNFQTSDKVVCVDDKNPSPYNIYPDGMVEAGRVYCVSGFVEHTGGLSIVGKPALSGNTLEDNGWKASRFRKLHENTSLVQMKEEALQEATQ